MSEITVSREDRPRIGKYVVYTLVGLVVANTFVGMLVQGTDNVVIAFGAVIVVAVFDIGLFFLMVQSLIQEWIAAAEIVEG